MRCVVVTTDQLWRDQPGGIGSYARGLVRGLAELVERGEHRTPVVALGPRGRSPLDLEGVQRLNTGWGVKVTTQLWERFSVGVPSTSKVVHATSMAGPFSGGTSKAVHSVAIFDLFWRDFPEYSTARGIAFHEQRLKVIRSHKDVRVITASPLVRDQLCERGFDESRLHLSSLGLELEGPEADLTTASRETGCSEELLGRPFTLAVGTVEPRKNLERLVTAHRTAMSRGAQLGPLVLVGPAGWGDIDLSDAVCVGPVSSPVLRALRRRALVEAYVPLAEGWGLPPVEALGAGLPVVVSNTVPSVFDNGQVDSVDPRSVDDISDALVRAATASRDEGARQQRRESVAHLTWRACARHHWKAWE